LLTEAVIYLRDFQVIIVLQNQERNYLQITQKDIVFIVLLLLRKPLELLLKVLLRNDIQLEDECNKKELISLIYDQMDEEKLRIPNMQIY